MPPQTPPSNPHDPRAVPESQCFGGAFVRGYRRVRQVASGARADIFLAERIATGSLVALKVVRDEPEHDEASDAFLRFLQEYEIAQRITPPRNRAAVRSRCQRPSRLAGDGVFSRAATCAGA